MTSDRFDRKFLDFPLCCLAYINGDKNRLSEIILYCVADVAFKMNAEKEFYGRVENTDFSFITAEDFDMSDKIHLAMAFASTDLGINLSSIKETTNVWMNVKDFVNAYEKQYGTDAYCRMPRQLTFEVLENKFSFREYCILAAIHSTLGKRHSFLRITNRQIAFRMNGYKSERIARKENIGLRLLTSRQISLSVDKLKMKNLIRTVLYSYREKYYSTKIKNEDTLRDMVAKMKLKQAEKRYNVEDREWSADVRKEIKRIKLTGQRNRMYFDSEDGV